MSAKTAPLSPFPGDGPIGRLAPVQEFLARRPVWQVCYLAGICAGILAEIWGLVARAVGVPMRAAGVGSHNASTVTVGMFALGVMVVTFWYTFAVVVMAPISGSRCRCSSCRSPLRGPRLTPRRRPR
jgi:hypothetical protein